MAISLVGQAGIAGGNQTSPQVISYASTNGNTLILAGFLYYATATVPGVSTITDSANNAWHYSTSSSQNPPYAFDGNNGNSITFVAWCINASPITSLTFTMPNSSPWTRVALSEWSGIGSFDSSASATSNAGTSASANLNLSTSSDLVVGAFENNTGNPTLGTPPGWVEFTSSGSVPNVAYGFPGVSGSYSPAFSLSFSDDWSVSFAAFSPPGRSNALLGLFP